MSVKARWQRAGQAERLAFLGSICFWIASAVIGGEDYRWSSPGFILTNAIGLGVIILFGLWRPKRREDIISLGLALPCSAKVLWTNTHRSAHRMRSEGLIIAQGLI